MIMRTHMPMSGRFRMIRNRLPIHMEAMMPQKSAGCSVITEGPGWMPWMIMAPTMSAMTGFDGMPRVSMGMKDVWAPALLADSGAATPSIIPLPKSLPYFETFFSIEYAAKAPRMEP